LQVTNWLDRILDRLALKLERCLAIMSTRDFWGIVAVGATVMGFLFIAFVMQTNFSIMRMRNCFYASNMSAYLMFNTLLFFVLAGLMALGEAFNYFDNKQRGIPHKRTSMFWMIIFTTTLGSIGLYLLKISC